MTLASETLREIRTRGHQQYKDLLAMAGREFSPLYPVKVPFSLGEFGFWSVESIWQGTKVVELVSPELMDPGGIPHTRLDEYGHLIWFPQAGEIRDGIAKSVFFRTLKSGKRYRGARNRVFGRDNWAFDGHVDPRNMQRIDEHEAKRRLHRHFYIQQLHQYPEALQRLSTMLRVGQLKITPEMIAAHSHLQTALDQL